MSDLSVLIELEVPHERDVSLGPMTWYGVGGNAAALARPRSFEQLSELIRRCRNEGIPTYVLGSGANLLVRDCGVEGIVLRLDALAFSELEIEGTKVTVGAGYDLFRLVLDTARASLAGLEVLAGIPASVGGAVRMNAGGAFGEIGHVVAAVRVMDEQGHIRELSRDDLHFTYRSSNIDAPFILEVTFELAEADPDTLMRRVKEIFLYKKNSQPMGAKSAGCVFKNPPEDVGATAGQLIDRAGLKGYRHAGAMISDVHANFVIVNDKEHTTGDHVCELIEHIEATVKEKFDVTLKRELVVWP